MQIDPHYLIAFLHVLAFVYWLGGDLGVFVLAKKAAAPGLAYDERMRMRKILYDIDMAPRTCLVLMVPLGFTLAQRWGIELPPGHIPAIWVFAAIWLAMVWFVHYRGTTKQGQMVRNVDMGVRILMLVGFLGYGLYLLLSEGGPPTWLALKVFMFGLIIANGIILRLSGGASAKALALLREGNEAEGQPMLEKARSFGARWALCIWALVGIMGFLGVVKPFT